MWMEPLYFFPGDHVSFLNSVHVYRVPSCFRRQKMNQIKRYFNSACDCVEVGFLNSCLWPCSLGHNKTFWNAFQQKMTKRVFWQVQLIPPCLTQFSPVWCLMNATVVSSQSTVQDKCNWRVEEERRGNEWDVIDILHIWISRSIWTLGIMFNRSKTTSLLDVYRSIGLA